MRPLPIPEWRHKISKVYWGMRIFDGSGYLFGRAFFDEPGALLVHRIDGGVQGFDASLIKANIERNYWVCQPDDPAVLGRWESKADAPDEPPGQTFNDGHALGCECGADYADTWHSEPPEWYFKGPEPIPLMGDSFEDGYRNGWRVALFKVLDERFKDHPAPDPKPKTWEYQPYGIDPEDPEQIVSFQFGHELAKKQTEWIWDWQVVEVCRKERRRLARLGKTVKTRQLSVPALSPGWKVSHQTGTTTREYRRTAAAVALL